MSAALAAVRAKGAAVVIATGRPAQAAMSILQQVGGHVDFLLCSCVPATRTVLLSVSPGSQPVVVFLQPFRSM